MRGLIIHMGVLLFVAVLALALPGGAWTAKTDLTVPVANAGARWRIGYMEGGTYGNYQWHLKALVLGLRQLRWVEVPDGFARMQFVDEKSMWEWLGRNATGKYLEFVQDAFWSGKWDASMRVANKEEAITRLSGRTGVDIVIAMGTWAGQDLANDSHFTPVMVLQSADPVRAGIVQSVAHSGLGHVFAHCDPARYKRQIRLFHEVVGFKKLGIAFEDTPTGRVYASIDDVLEVCGQFGVEVVQCHTVTHTPDQSRALESYRNCHERLALEVDAMYISNSAVVKPQTLPELLVPFMAARIPTFAQMGAEAVRHGVLLSSTQGDFKAIGMFYARTLSQILHGVKPGSLPQEYADVSHIAINLDTAKAIGFTPSNALLNAASTVLDASAGRDGGPEKR